VTNRSGSLPADGSGFTVTRARVLLPGGIWEEFPKRLGFGGRRPRQPFI
jgi:hypothetical protein